MASLADAMEAHDRASDATQERQLIQRLGRPRSWYYYDSCKLLGNALAHRGDSAGAAEYWQVFLLQVLDDGGAFTDEMAYVDLPQLVHRHRGRGFVQHGMIPDAMREFRVFLATAPAHAQLAIDLVPEMKQLGHEAAARELFDLSFKTLDRFCVKYPDSAHFHNEIAWLATRCGYEPDAALLHARRAVELLPHDTNGIDTLAEVYFHRGDRERAVALMKQCEELEPGQPRHRQRREEFEKGKP